MSKILTFREMQIETKDSFWDDYINIERVMIEAHICPKCQRSLTYKGVANAAEFRGYGVCEKCDYAKLFFKFAAPISDFTRKIAQAVQKNI